jgi:hypothetical protein
MAVDGNQLRTLEERLRLVEAFPPHSPTIRKSANRLIAVWGRACV